MGVASRVPTYPTIPHMLGLPFRGIGPLQDRVARIGETEAGELRHLREQAACQPRGHEQRAALRTERVLALGQRRFQGYITTWARHGSGFARIQVRGRRAAPWPAGRASVRRRSGVTACRHSPATFRRAREARPEETIPGKRVGQGRIRRTVIAASTHGECGGWLASPAAGWPVY